MKKSILLLLLVTACAPYKPNLASQPKDMVKYEADRSSCIQQGRDRKNKSGMFGADSFKAPKEMADECMAAKGYDVVKASH